MSQQAEKLETSHPILSYGRVENAEDAVFRVRAEAGSLRAGQAAGCLLLPEPGDLVMLSLDAFGRAYILCVLERGNPEAVNRLLLRGQSRIEVAGGGFSMACEQGLDLASARQLSLTASDFSLCATQADISLEETRMAGKNLTASLERIRTVAHTMDTFVKNWVQRMVSCFRYVREHDEKQCASARALVSGTLTVQTGNSVHTAEGHVKIDAEQIHLG